MPKTSQMTNIVLISLRHIAASFLGGCAPPLNTLHVSPLLFLQAFGALKMEDAEHAFERRTSQDAQEFLMRLLDHLRTEGINKVGRSPDEKTIMETLLEGEYVASVSTARNVIDD